MCRTFSCREFVEAIEDFLSAEADPETLADLDHHLAGCMPCEAYLKTYVQTARLTRRAFRCAAPPPALPGELLTRLLGRRG